jgi:aerobic C4-dicarboxylate transport protein
VVVSKWEKELDHDRMEAVLSGKYVDGGDTDVKPIREAA